MQLKSVGRLGICMDELLFMFLTFTCAMQVSPCNFASRFKKRPSGMAMLMRVMRESS